MGAASVPRPELFSGQVRLRRTWNSPGTTSRAGTWSSIEREVAFAALSGMSIAEIARERDRSEIAVRKQLRSAVCKAGAVDRLDLAVSLDATIR